MDNGKGLTMEGLSVPNINRLALFIKRKLKLNRFLLVIDTKKGVIISAITIIIVDLIDLLWNLSMTFGPLNSTMTTLLLLETFLVICVSSALLHAMKTDNKADLRSILLTWLVVVAIDYTLRATLNFSSLIISEKASTTAKVMRSLATIVILVLVAHCWQCVFTYYDDNNGKITTVKITPSDDKGRSQFTKRQMMMMRPSYAQTTELSAANLERGASPTVTGIAAIGSSSASATPSTGANMLRAPTEDAAKMRCNTNKVSSVKIEEQVFILNQLRSFHKLETMSNDSSNWLNYIAFDLWHEIGDPESEQFFWLKGPWLTLLATFAYLYIVMKGGPDFMRNRKPYDLKWSIRLYNLILVIINAYLFYWTLVSFNYGRDFWGCGEALNTKKRGVMLKYGHMFFHTRYLEFFDTFFFILRKKYQQLTFLHVFHHAIVPTLMYIGLKFYPLPFNSLLPLTNMFVHVIMYAYYGLATFGPSIQPYLWWKKYLTIMQISQFVVLLIHCAQPIIFYNRPECKFPTTAIFINLGIGLTFLSLFLSFYRKSYGKNEKLKTKRLLKDGRCNGLHESSKKHGIDTWVSENKRTQ